MIYLIEMGGAMDREIKNCLTCGTGKNWWFRTRKGFQCPICGGNPLRGDGRSDWEDLQRARMVKMFGSRQKGDAELARRYRKEI